MKHYTVNIDLHFYADDDIDAARFATYDANLLVNQNLALSYDIKRTWETNGVVDQLPNHRRENQPA